MRAAPAVVAALCLLAAREGRARLILVNGPRGPVHVNVPEPAAAVAVHPSARALPFRPVIEESAARHGVDANLVEAVVACESNFDSEAVSRAGACGLMQLMPDTAAAYGLEDPFDVEGNIDAGTRHLADLLRAFGGDRRLAIAAYNAGRGAVERAAGVPPYPETRKYVEKVEGYFAERRGEVPPAPDASSEAPEDAPPARKGPPPRVVRDARGRIVFTNQLATPSRP